MDGCILQRARPPAQPKRLTPWQEYERAVVVSRQWREAWERTNQQRYLLVANACQQMAQEWLGVAHRSHEISRSVFEHEVGKLAPPREPELELA